MTFNAEQAFLDGAKLFGDTAAKIETVVDDINLKVDAKIDQMAGSVSGRNLLVNSNFKINQRGYLLTENIPTWTHIRDRWQTTSDLGIITVAVDGTVTLSALARQSFIQNQWAGKKVTISVKDPSVDMIVHAGLGSFATIQAGAGIKSVTIVGDSVGSSAGNFYMKAATGSGDPYSFKDLKIELGEVATRYDVPDEDEELLKCQKDCLKLNAVLIKGGLGGNSAGKYIVTIPYPIRMRSDPTVSGEVIGNGGFAVCSINYRAEFANANIDYTFTGAGSSMTLTALLTTGY